MIRNTAELIQQTIRATALNCIDIAVANYQDARDHGNIVGAAMADNIAAEIEKKFGLREEE